MIKICLYCNNRYNASRSDQYYCSAKCRKKANNPSSGLVLSIKKEWFDMILRGEKLEEYREIKPFYTTRFTNYFGSIYNIDKEKDVDGNIPIHIWNKHPKHIILRNGYGEKVPAIEVLCTLTENYGKPEWGAKVGIKYYVLKIHKIINKWNLKEN